MNSALQQSFTQFDAQTNDRTSAHINLSNLFLQIERGEVELNRDSANQLWLHLRQTYPPHEGDPMRDYWNDEFLKLPNGDMYFS